MGTGGAEPADGGPGLWLQQEGWGRGLQWWSDPSLGEMDPLGTGTGPSKILSRARVKTDCCCCTCWHPTSPAGGCRPGPRSSSSWWTGGPCLCYYGDRKDQESVTAAPNQSDLNVLM